MRDLIKIKLWKQKNATRLKLYRKNYYLTHKDEFKKRAKKDKRHHLRKRPKEIRDWYDSSEKVCFYCGIKESELLSLLKGRFARNKMTVDRKDSTMSYQLDNVVLACWRCNTLKSDFFTAEEFLEIANKYIKPKLRL